MMSPYQSCNVQYFNSLKFHVQSFRFLAELTKKKQERVLNFFTSRFSTLRIHHFQRLSILEKRFLKGREDFAFPIDPLFHERFDERCARRRSAIVRAIHTCVTFGDRGGEGWKKKGFREALKRASLVLTWKDPGRVVSENVRLPCTVGLEF